MILIYLKYRQYHTDIIWCIVYLKIGYGVCDTYRYMLIFKAMNVGGAAEIAERKEK